jgi:hypothetical protein
MKYSLHNFEFISSNYGNWYVMGSFETGLKNNQKINLKFN